MEVSGTEGEEDRSGGGWIERLVGERAVRGGSTRPSLMETSLKKHRPHIKVRKDTEVEEEY